MFEKEAKNWVKEHTDIDYKASYGEFPIEPSAIKSFKAGAEFGYNKANEWHFDKVPANENDILCQIAKDESVVGYYSESKKRYYTIDGQSIEVIAWKEIVLPELKEIK